MNPPILPPHFKPSPEYDVILTRVLEPELMNSEAEAREYNAMDHSLVNSQFVGDLLSAHRASERVLDVGTGTAIIPIKLCERDKRSLVFAVDASEPMLQHAAHNVAAAGLVGRIHLTKVDAKCLPYDDKVFPTVISNSLVHHIEHPERVIAEMVRVVAPGGTLFVRDLSRPANEPAVATLVRQHAANGSAMQRALFEASLRAALNPNELRNIVNGLGLSGERIHQTSDRHWTWIFQH